MQGNRGLPTEFLVLDSHLESDEEHYRRIDGYKKDVEKDNRLYRFKHAMKPTLLVSGKDYRKCDDEKKSADRDEKTSAGRNDKFKHRFHPNFLHTNWHLADNSSMTANSKPARRIL